MANLTPFGGRSLFDEFFRDVAPGYFIKPLHGDALPAQIKVDVSENTSAYTVAAEVPGVAKDDIHVAVDGGVVTISAEVRQQDQQTKEDKVLRSERYYGQVSRSFQLPVEVDAAAARAKYDNGVLTLTLPKKTQPGSKRLAID
ncbi:MAG: Hsp20/alpha crystallin family protein [Burkholderiales bacterium]|nr:Hsp20/alpha crystallin family protein [Burkholderiales bacterium]